MIQYKVKGSKGIDTFVEITAEHEQGFDVLITSVCDGYKKEMHEYITRDLFETCLRTGYLTKIGNMEGTLISA